MHRMRWMHVVYSMSDTSRSIQSQPLTVHPHEPPSRYTVDTGKEITHRMELGGKKEESVKYLTKI
jgi:hypothetical protein